MTRFALPALAIGLAVSAACSDDAPLQPPQHDADIPDAGPADAGAPDAGPDAPPPPTGARDYDAVAYELRGHYDWDADALVASEDVTLQVGSPVDGKIELDTRVQLSAVRAGTQALPFVADATAGTVVVDLTPLVPRAQELTLTFDFRAPATGDGLTSFRARVVDPAPGHVALTDSEPVGGVQWLVAKQDPSDRARFAVELTVAADEDLVSNGRRVKDETTADARVVRYEIDKPIPPYIMAFAAGHLEHTDATSARGVPLSVWHRRGLAIDAEQYLRDIARSMATFEALLGPYPWDSYGVVLVPKFNMGGMENATLSFISEKYARNDYSYDYPASDYAFQVNAHELAHQWFGDWVTIHSFDDLWVKEGMATLLGAEAQRAHRDGEGKGRLFGNDFAFRPDYAIVDTSLPLDQRYTTGPYQRAAWVLTQIRARVGDDAFWAALRGVLAGHGLGTVDGASFVRAFAPALDAATIERVIASLPAPGAPSIDVQFPAQPGRRDVTFTLHEGGGQLLTPVELTVVDADGQASVQTLVPEVPLALSIPDGGYLAPDEGDVHPWSVLVGYDAINRMGSYLRPSTPAALAAFESRSAAQQERALEDRNAPAVGADRLREVYAQLDSSFARDNTLQAACRALEGLPAEGADAAAWVDALAPLIADPPLPAYRPWWRRCGVALPRRALAPQLATLGAHPTDAAMARLEYLVSFNYGEVDSLALISPLVTQTFSLRLQNLAISRLSNQLTVAAFPAVREHRSEWLAFFRAQLAVAAEQQRAENLWFPLYWLRDTAALPVLADFLHRIPMPGGSQRFFICEAKTVAGSPTAGAWTEFQNAMQPWSSLSAEAQAVLADPSTCSN